MARSATRWPCICRCSSASTSVPGNSTCFISINRPPVLDPFAPIDTVHNDAGLRRFSQHQALERLPRGTCALHLPHAQRAAGAAGKLGQQHSSRPAVTTAWAAALARRPTSQCLGPHRTGSHHAAIRIAVRRKPPLEDCRQIYGVDRDFDEIEPAARPAGHRRIGEISDAKIRLFKRCDRTSRADRLALTVWPGADDRGDGLRTPVIAYSAGSCREIVEGRPHRLHRRERDRGRRCDSRDRLPSRRGQNRRPFRGALHGAAHGRGLIRTSTRAWSQPAERRWRLVKA